MAKLEEHNIDLEDTLQQVKQANVTDLEVWLQRNNLCIHGVPEDEENNNMMDFWKEVENKVNLFADDVLFTLKKPEKSTVTSCWNNGKR